MPENQPSAYRPFSNGSEFDHWSMSNCHICRWGAESDETPRCCGEYGLSLGMMGDGSVPVMAIDFIGTTERTSSNDRAYCKLKKDCDQFQYPDELEDELSGEISVNKDMALKDAELAETISEGFDKHGYGLTDLIRQQL